MTGAMENKLHMPEPRLVEEIGLPNGLKAEFYDCSRRLAGDRWYICLLTRVPVHVREQDFEDYAESCDIFREFCAHTGGIVHFEVKKERNFIDEREKDEVFASLLNRQKAQLAYMGHSNFARGVIRRHLAEYKERRSWWK